MYDFDKIVDRQSTANIKYDLRKKIFGQEDVIPMWVADMDFETPDFIRDAVVERARHPIYGYSFRVESYYQSIANWLKRRHNWSINTKWLVYSPGIVPALNMSTLCYTDEGDKIIVQPPVYFPFFNAATDHNRVLLHNNLILENDRYVIDFEDFEQKAKDARMFFLSSPHNPVGRVWTKEELLRLGEICVRNNVIIISDEIHNDLVLPGFEHIPVASLSPEIADITVTCIAPSKTFNIAGLATSSVVISNRELRIKFEKTINSLHLSLGNLFGAVASQAGYENGDSWVDELMQYVNGNFIEVDKALEKANKKIKLIKPESTYLAWLDFRGTGLNDNEIKKRLVKDAGLGLSHGPVFGNGGQGFQRMNLAAPRSVVKEAMEKLLQVFNFLCP